MSDGKPVDHLRTVLDVEQTSAGKVSAICVSESGDQCEMFEEGWRPLRVFADSMPQTGIRTES
jgi:hypothetical protein